MLMLPNGALSDMSKKIKYTLFNEVPRQKIFTLTRVQARSNQE